MLDHLLLRADWQKTDTKAHRGTLLTKYPPCGVEEEAQPEWVATIDNSPGFFWILPHLMVCLEATGSGIIESQFLRPYVSEEDAENQLSDS